MEGFDLYSDVNSVLDRNIETEDYDTLNIFFEQSYPLTFDDNGCPNELLFM